MASVEREPNGGLEAEPQRDAGLLFSEHIYCVTSNWVMPRISK